MVSAVQAMIGRNRSDPSRVPHQPRKLRPRFRSKPIVSNDKIEGLRLDQVQRLIDVQGGHNLLNAEPGQDRTHHLLHERMIVQHQYRYSVGAKRHDLFP
jgi:hypothetical protein